MDILHIEKDYTDGLFDKIISVLGRGGLVVYPTDTVYGLLADATGAKAVRKLIAFKNRPPGKPVSVFVETLGAARAYVRIDEDRLQTIQPLVPGPFTFVFPSLHKLPVILESERGTLGIRLPNYLPVQRLVSRFGKPLTATSANLAGRAPHHSLGAFLSDLSPEKQSLIDLVVDAGTLPHNRPSTVVDLSDADVRILRAGDLPFKKEEVFLSQSDTETKDLARRLFAKFVPGIGQKPLIFLLRGPLGAGKTIFAKGLGEVLSVADIVSPTYVIYYEYKTAHHVAKTLIHADFFNLGDDAELKHLGLDEYLVPGSVLCIEWGDRAGGIIGSMKEKGTVVDVEIVNTGSHTRTIIARTL